jgi:hypothetical protein
MTVNNSNLIERRDQILAHISQLQGLEQDLTNQLDALNSTDPRRLSINNKINEISQMRIDLYRIINDMYSYNQDNVTHTRNILSDQLAAIAIIETELNENKKRLNMLNQQKNNKVKLVQINTYYGKYYNARKQIMVTIVLICVPVLILTILGNMGILPSNLYALLIMIIIIIGSISIGYQIIDLSNRDNMNFDEYNWKFNKNLAPPIDDTAIDAYDPWASIPAACINDACCPKPTHTYSSTTNNCVLITSPPATAPPTASS